MKKWAVLLACVCCFGCTHSLKSAAKDGKIAPAFNDTLLTGDYFWVRGLGAANPAHTSDSQRRIMSREAAIAHAYQRATEALYGTQLDSHVQVVDALSVGSTIDTSSSGIIQHMELFSTEYLEDDGCTVIMRLSRQQLKQAGLDPESKK